MKKAIILLVLVATFSPFTHAQENANSTQTRKPQAGNFTTELNLNLFRDGLNISNYLNQIRGRYFISENTALRLRAQVYFDYYHMDSLHSDHTSKLLVFSLNPGIEKHFVGTPKLSPYMEEK